MEQDTFTSDALSEDEKSYFENKGEVDAPEVENEPETVENEPVETENPPETAAKSDDDAGKKQEDQRKVDYRALREERDKRRQLESQLQQLNDQRARDMELINQRLAILQQPPQQPQQPQIPDPEGDIFGAVKYTVDQLQAMKQQQEQERIQHARQAEENRRRAAFENQVVQTWRNTAAEFVQEEPTFPEAYEYIKTQRYKELVASGMPADHAARQSSIDEFNFVASQLQGGRNPAVALLEVAKARGWAPKAPVQPPAHERLQTVNEGQKANASLSSVGTAGSARGKLDAHALAKMSQDEFEAFIEKRGAKGFKAILGG